MGTTTPKATLDITGDKGMLLPRMADHTTLVPIDGTLDATEAGLQVYNTTTNKVMLWDGTAWVVNESKWTNDATNTRVVLTNLSDGTTARTAGTEFVVTDAGNLGIGNLTGNIEGWNANSKVLSISAPNLTTQPNGASIIELQGRRTIGGFGLLNFISYDNATSTNTTVGRISVDADAVGNPDAGVMKFTTKETGVAESVKMAILGNGNVGIGTTTPTSLLHLNNGTTNQNLLLDPANISSTGTNGLTLNAASGSGFIAARVAGDERMRILANGNVGIGTTAPEYALDIRRDAGIVNVFQMRGITNGNYILAQRSAGTLAAPTNTSANSRFLRIGGGGYNGTAWINEKATIDFTTQNAWSATDNSTSINFNTTPNGSTTTAERMRITGEGNVGIGIAVPTATLHVNGTSKIGPYFAISSTASILKDFANIITNQHGDVLLSSNLYNSNISDELFVAKTHVSIAGTAIRLNGNTVNKGDIQFWTTAFGAVTADDAYAQTIPSMVVKSNRNVGIGTNSPTEKLEVDGAVKIGTRADAGATVGTIRYNSTTNKFQGQIGVGQPGADANGWVDLH